ncbi:MAG: bifunctional adenosylcobinamide kinase/adenosylcobinamide-phosphate guanylyltransferase [Micromonosporaceae bacterium]
MHTLVLGGIRSGKSAYAERLVGDAERVTYLATATDRPGDAEWAARLEAHRRRRPDGWRTRECGDQPGMLPRLLREARPGDTLLVDDLGGWITAWYDAAGWRDGATDAPIAELSAALAGSPATVVLVSPEVGLSLVPDNRAGRRFADALGSANRAVADVCDRVALVVAGQPLWIKSGAASNLSP